MYVALLGFLSALSCTPTAPEGGAASGSRSPPSTKSGYRQLSIHRYPRCGRCSDVGTSRIPRARRAISTIAPLYPQARRSEADTPAGASRRWVRSSQTNRRSCAVVQTSPRFSVRHTAWPRPVSRASRRGGESPQLRISLRNCHIVHRRAFVLFLIGKSRTAAAPEGGGVVS